MVTIEQAEKVLEVVDKGLCSGLGKPFPGQMCVEAAVCYGLGQEHGDRPICVHESVRAYKIEINDARWSSNQARAKGLRKIAIAQLGSIDSQFNSQVFVEHLVLGVVNQILPLVLEGIVDSEIIQSCVNAKTLEAAAEEAEAARSAAWTAAWTAKTAAAKAAAETARSTAWTAKTAAAAKTEAAKTAAAWTAKTAKAAAEAARSAAKAAKAAAEAARSAAWTAKTAKTAKAAEAETAWTAAWTAKTAKAAWAAKAEDKILILAANIGVDALRKANSPGIALMDTLISKTKGL